MPSSPFLTDLAHWVWDTRYRLRGAKGSREADLGSTLDRIAGAVASVEADAPVWAAGFRELLSGLRFLPGGRILAGAGGGYAVTLLNCFAMGALGDSLPEIFAGLEEGALSLRAGGGVGYDFSTLRPHGALARRSGGIASGPLPFMDLWDAMCATIGSTSARGGAMMGVLRCDHPDIESFVVAKSIPGRLTHFNLSVAVSDAFMSAVEAGARWPLRFPAETGRAWKEVPARILWDQITRAAWESGEPGVLFIDRINAWNNLAAQERIATTNPCGEIPLPPYGACDLGSLNLSRLVLDPFTPQARLDWPLIERMVPLAVRFLDDVLSLSAYPLPAQREQALGSRRIGLGVTGLADALAMAGLHYGTQAARDWSREALRRIRDLAWETSVAIAREKAPFPRFERDAFLEAPFVHTLPDRLRDAIARHGVRNSHLLAIAPAGTISLLADNCSSGIEPIFALEQVRRVRDPEGRVQEWQISDYALGQWRRLHGEEPPPAFVEAPSLPPEAHLAMQAALQPLVDNAISKTINVPADYPLAAFRDLYRQAWQAGLKGCTLYRPNPRRGAVLEAADGSGCCRLG